MVSRLCAVDSCFGPTVHAELSSCCLDALRLGLGVDKHAHRTNYHLHRAGRADRNGDAVLGTRPDGTAIRSRNCLVPSQFAQTVGPGSGASVLKL